MRVKVLMKLLELELASLKCWFDYFQPNLIPGAELGWEKQVVQKRPPSDVPLLNYTLSVAQWHSSLCIVASRKNCPILEFKAFNVCSDLYFSCVTTL